MLTGREAILFKIRACLALAAPKSNGTDGERAAARAMAEKMILKHSVREEELKNVPRKKFIEKPLEEYDEGITIVVDFSGIKYSGNISNSTDQT